jgi:hypothetical protein
VIYSEHFHLFLTWNKLIFQEHLNQAHPNPVCEFCGEKFNSTIRLGEHKQKECTKITVPCALKDYGCLSSVSWQYSKRRVLKIKEQEAVIYKWNNI